MSNLFCEKSNLTFFGFILVIKSKCTKTARKTVLLQASGNPEIFHVSSMAWNKYNLKNLHIYFTSVCTDGLE